MFWVSPGCIVSSHTVEGWLGMNSCRHPVLFSRIMFASGSPPGQRKWWPSYTLIGLNRSGCSLCQFFITQVFFVGLDLFSVYPWCFPPLFFQTVFPSVVLLVSHLSETYPIQFPCIYWKAPYIESGSIFETGDCAQTNIVLHGEQKNNLTCHPRWPLPRASSSLRVPYSIVAGCFFPTSLEDQWPTGMHPLKCLPVHRFDRHESLHSWNRTRFSFQKGPPSAPRKADLCRSCVIGLVLFRLFVHTYSNSQCSLIGP